MNDSANLLKVSTLKRELYYPAPDGSEIRPLREVTGGNLVHCTLPPSGVSLAVRHKTVEEIWYFLDGVGEVWRKLNDHEAVVSVRSGYCLAIPLGCHFQFRNTGTVSLTFIIATIQKWPGESEAVRVPDHWETLATGASKKT